MTDTGYRIPYQRRHSRPTRVELIVPHDSLSPVFVSVDRVPVCLPIHTDFIARILDLNPIVIAIEIANATTVTVTVTATAISLSLVFKLEWSGSRSHID